MSMQPYAAPVDAMRLALRSTFSLDTLCGRDAFAHITDELIGAVLDEAARFAAEVLDPLNRKGDREGSGLRDGTVHTATGFRDAYRAFVENGWHAMDFPQRWGGQSLPRTVAAACSEMWSAANMSFALCPLLTHGAAELLLHHGSEAQQALYLPKLVPGIWTGTMCMTEPEAGSDVGALRCQAVPEGDHYRLRGSKIFITYGEHDLAENIIHMVLARLPDAPPGIKGVSLFMVPKYLPDAGGLPGMRNDVICTALEHKLGIHASPTAALSFGEGDGAIGYLVGEAGRGIHCMFTMMNSARLGVGLEGVAVTDRAAQAARYYAGERVQSRAIAGDDPQPVAIIHHPDVARMVRTLEAHALGLRGLAYLAAAALDLAAHHSEAAARREYGYLSDFLTPIVKAHATQVGFDAASLCMQVYGGMGYIEESGVPQLLRDARIALIYEGANGIQGLDLVMRKLHLDAGRYVYRLIHALQKEMRTLAGLDEDSAAGIVAGLESLTQITQVVQGWTQEEPVRAAAVVTPYLRMAGLVLEGCMIARQATVAADEPALSIREEAPALLGFFVRQLLPEIHGLEAMIRQS